MPTKFDGRLIAIIVAIAIILALFVAYLSISKQSIPDFIQKYTNKNQVPVVESASVNITKNGFQPQTINIKKGTSVTFYNNDSVSHKIASDPHPTHDGLKDFVSDTIRKNESYSVLFNQTGTFNYHDEADPIKLKGSVNVQ